MRYETGTTLLDLIYKSSDSGIYYIGVNTINELHTVFTLTSQWNLIWRGQMRKEWSLESTLSRIVNPVPDNKNIDSILMKQLNNFKYSSRGRRGANPPLEISDDEWWALGQHHGLATPLLDWSFSPYVAAFFAFNKEIEDTTNTDHNSRVVYAINRSAIEELSSVVTGLHPNKFEKVRFIKPNSNDNARMINQNGLFSFGPLTVDLETWITNVYEKLSEDNIIPNSVMPKPIMYKILINEDLREQILITLNRMNVNYLTLYPDIEGASLHSNISLKIKRYTFD